jgi:hypothetical protein
VDKEVKTLIDQLSSPDNRVRVSALQDLMRRTDSTADWAYKAWDGLLQKLDDQSSYQRSIAILLLSNLAKNDTEGRLIGSLDCLLAHTNDDSFITSRQRTQSLWKVACVDNRAKERVLDHLQFRFTECEHAKHDNLLRQHIIQPRDPCTTSRTARRSWRGPTDC